MNTQNNNPTTRQHIRDAVFSGLSTVGFIVIIAATLLLFCPLASAETYEVIEDGQVYLVETEEVVVAAPKSKTPDELDVEIGDKIQKLNKRLNDVTEIAMDEKLKLFTDKQKKHIERELARANNANDRLKKSKGFKEIGKKHKFKEDKSNPSAQELYSAEAAAEDDDDYEVDALEDLSLMIDDMNSLLDQTEGELIRLTEIEELKEQAAVMLAAGEDPHEVYTKLENLMKKSPVTTGFYVATEVAKFAAIVSATAFDISTCITRQSTAGWNVSVAGIVFAAADGIFQGIAEGLQIKVDYDEAQLSDAGYNCLIQIGTEHAQMMGDIEGINGQVVSIQADANTLGDSVDLLLIQLATTDEKVDGLIITTDRIEGKIDTLTGKVDTMHAQMNERFDAMTALLNQRFEYVEQLLCTPQGSRPNFPTKNNPK
jgi:hypothetical protein